MYQKQERVSTGGAVALLTLLSAISLERGMTTNSAWYFLLCFTVPVLLIHRFFGHRSDHTAP
jgi:hypothetical protein